MHCGKATTVGGESSDADAESEDGSDSDGGVVEVEGAVGAE
jgi:hypothetical protein